MQGEHGAGSERDLAVRDRASEGRGDAPVGAQGYDYEAFSTLTGPFVPVTSLGEGYKVAYRSVMKRRRDRVGSLVLVAAAIVAESVFLVWLLQPGHMPVDQGDWKYYLSLTMVGTIGLIEALRLVNVATLVRATMISRHPEPVAPQSGHRVAFITTIVPTKEPIEMARKTLAAAVALEYDGPFDVWLLDEGNDPDVKAMCAELGVNHFSRHGIERWNTERGPHKRKTKHGNYNAWLEAHGEDYDLWVSVDTDHVPLPNFVERLLGYFRDPDVAFVVGPQVYGNYDNPITRWAESQQFLFHSTLQPAGNKHDAAMFVGTNNAVRICALKQIGGLADSITEDAASSLAWHTTRNPLTKRTWKSVYTPDVLAVGEGPETWGDYFIQQNRWARGTDEVVLRKFWRHLPRLRPGRALHYLFLMSYYPSAAIAWMLGTFNLVAYLVTGAGGVVVAAQLWAMLYVNASVLQIGIYVWNRRYNVSPHEEAGAAGIAGMFVSILSAPMYVTALLDAVRGRNVPFEVTPKGESGGRDTIKNFRKNIMWGSVLAAALIASVPLGHDHPAMRSWALLGVAISFTPVVLWKVWEARAAREAAAGGVPAVLDLRDSAPRGTGHRDVLDTSALDGRTRARTTGEPRADHAVPVDATDLERLPAALLHAPLDEKDPR